MLNKPWSLYAISAHDDALYVQVAQSILAGEWLGVYDDRILAKPPGFAFFIALSAAVGLPFNISVAIFNAVAAAIFAVAIRQVTGSRIAASMVFALTLLSPQYFMLERVLRENIYPSQILVLVGLLIFSFTQNYSLKWLVPAGLIFGWIWITREDGIWLLPGTALFFLITSQTLRVKIKSGLVFLVSASVVVVSLGVANLAYYGRWATAEVTDSTFVSMISATQSVRNGGFIPQVAVPKAAREHLYDASPLFATLRPVIESPNYFGFACDISPERCGEIGNGWWHWAVRYAAFQKGYHQSPQKAAKFYGQVRDDIEAACSNGALTCDVRPVASLPTMSLNDLWKVPSYVFRIVKKVLLVEPVTISSSASIGSDATVASMFNFLNRPPSFEAKDSATPFLQSIQSYNASLKSQFVQFVMSLYRIVFLISLALVIYLGARRVFATRIPRFDIAQCVILVLVVYAASRVGLIGLLGVTSFNTDTAIYIGPVYQIAAAILVLSGFVLARPRDQARKLE